MRRLPDEGDSQNLFQDHPSEGHEAEPAGAHWLCGEPGGSTAPAMCPLASLAPPATHSPPRASTTSPGVITSSGSIHSYSSRSDSQPSEPFLPTLSPSPPNPTDSEPCPQPPIACSVPPPNSTPTHTQFDSMALQLGTIPWSLSPYAHWLAPPTRIISGVGRANSPIPAPSRHQADAKAWSLLTSSQCTSHQEHLSHHPPEVSFWGHPTDKQEEVYGGSASSPVKFPRANSAEPERGLMRYSTWGLGKTFPEKILSAHSGRKLGKNSECQTPGGVHPSMFAVNQAMDLPAESLTHRGATKNPAPSKGQGPDTSTSHGFTIFKPPIQQNLEAHATRLLARCR
ncbi:spermatogenesis-associated protein 31A1-like [Manis javanica]|uniref:spermatogenesis-associated protein 31A1-like n=1 Tax=Manis javanica TaxID=9974 RepID=UPI003C6D2D6A